MDRFTLERKVVEAAAKSVLFAAVVVMAVVDHVVNCEHAEKRGRAVVYAARKKARKGQPREIRETSQCPVPEIVNVRLSHRLPISTAWQEMIMGQWTDLEFVEHFRLNKEGFVWLVHRLEPFLQYGRVGHGGKRPTPVWALIAATLSWLAGGRSILFREKFGMRKSTFKQRRWLVVDAIVTQLQHELVRFPTTLEEMQRVSDGMRSWCHFDGVVGALDGLIVRCSPFSPKLQGIMRCDRHDAYGYNLQAICDAEDRIIWFAANRYASCADGRAFRTTKLFDELEEGLLTCDGQVERGQFFILGDNAYPLRYVHWMVLLHALISCLLALFQKLPTSPFSRITHTRFHGRHLEPEYVGGSFEH